MTVRPSITSGTPAGSGSASSTAVNGNSEFDGQNLQVQKEAFLDKARTGNVADDYLKYTRTPQLSRFEIKAGWEIPAALEQGLNSDLPGELKALVMSNVYDTATSQYLLIPQASRGRNLAVESGRRSPFRVQIMMTGQFAPLPLEGR